MITLKTLIEFVEQQSFNDNPFKLDDCTTILNQKEFCQTHINFLKNNKGKRIFLPYFDRLKKYYILINTQTDETPTTIVERQ